MTPESDLETLVFQQKVAKGPVRFIVVSASVFGVLMWVGFFAQLSNLQPDDYLLLGLGVVFGGFAWLFHRFTHLPRFVLTAGEVQIRGLSLIHI